MDTITAQEVDGKLLEFIEKATDALKQYRITSPKGTVIMVPEETYNNLIVTLELLSTPGLMDTMCRGKPEINEKFLSELS